MSEWNISKTIKDKVLLRVQKSDNDIKILYILRNLGPQRFSELPKYCNLSKSTVSKYLKSHIKKNRIKKKIYSNPNKGIQEQRYFITERGIEKLEDISNNKDNDLNFISELNETILKLSDLIEFYRAIGVDDSITFQIVRIILSIGENYFIIEQNRELYLTLFYMINYNSILTPNYKINLKQFCEVYDIKELYIEYYVDKIMSNNIGFFMFIRENDVFFFHQEDLLGTTTIRLIKDKLIEEMSYINLIGYRKIYDLDKIAEEIAEKLKNMNLIWDEIQEQFEMLIEKLFIKIAIEMGISKTFLMDIVIQSEKLSKSKEGINSLIRIIEGSRKYEDLNIVSIPSAKEVHLSEKIGPVKGFCPNCGKIILEQDLSNKCSKCEQIFNPKDLLVSIDDAKESSIRYKELVKEELFKCPNSECDYYVKSSWDVCPVCLTPIKQDNNI